MNAGISLWDFDPRAPDGTIQRRFAKVEGIQIIFDELIHAP